MTKPDEAAFRGAMDAAIDKYVKQQGRNTIALNAERDPACAGYARIPGPDACDFCVTMGAHESFYHTRETAGGGEGHGTADDRYHPYCNCEVCLVFRKGGRLLARDPDTGDPVDYDGADMIRRYNEAGRPTFAKGSASGSARRRGNRQPAAKKPARNNMAGAKLADEEFDAAMKSLADARTSEELHETADRIVRSWKENANGRNEAQWDRLSRFAKARENDLKEAAESKRRWTSDEKLARIKDIDAALKSEKPVFVLPNKSNSDLLRNIEQITPEEGYYDIHAHGSHVSVDCYGTSIEAKDLAYILSKRDDYHGQKIRLFSCRAGSKNAGGDCFAQQLSDIIGVEVKAAPDVTIIRKDGSFYFGRPDVINFEVFRPKKQ